MTAPNAETAADATPSPQGDVEVVHLSVDGRYDAPDGLDNPRPTLGWRMVETGRARSHPCHRPGARIPCPADKQTAYEVQAAETAERLKAGDLVWAFTANMVA